MQIRIHKEFGVVIDNVRDEMVDVFVSEDGSITVQVNQVDEDDEEGEELDPDPSLSGFLAPGRN